MQQASSPGEAAWALKLGRERSQYGDIPNSGLWKHGYTGQFGGTDILFRAGSSTQRYYVTSSPGADRWRISRTTMIKGAIRKDWLIFVEKGREPRIKKPGPLWKYGGGRIVGAIPKMALADLQNPVPLALYHSNVHRSYCSFIGPSGRASEDMDWEPEIVTSSGGSGYSLDFSKLPRTDKPYPITPQERAYANRKRPPSRGR